MRTHPGYWLGSVLFGILTCSASPVPAQSLLHVPIHGVTGTLALPESVDKFYSDVNKALVKIDDGLDHLGRAKKRTRVDGDAASLASLHPGTAVVVHYTVKGMQVSRDDIDETGRPGSALNAGTVTAVDRPGKRITITFADGERARLRLTRSPAHGGRVVVYSRDGSGRPIARYFKPASS